MKKTGKRPKDQVLVMLLDPLGDEDRLLLNAAGYTEENLVFPNRDAVLTGKITVEYLESFKSILFNFGQSADVPPRDSIFWPLLRDGCQMLVLFNLPHGGETCERALRILQFTKLGNGLPRAAISALITLEMADSSVIVRDAFFKESMTA